MGTGFDRLAVGLAEGRSRREAFRMAFGVGAGASAATLVWPMRSRASRGRVKPPLICSSPAPPTPGTCGAQSSYDYHDGCPAGGNEYSTGTPSTYNGCGPEGGINTHIFGNQDIIPDQPLGLADFYSACAGHDCCYGTCQSDKSACDLNFAADLIAICEAEYQQYRSISPILAAAQYAACVEVAQIYYHEVSSDPKGQEAYDTAQNEDCKCCCPDGKAYCNGECLDVSADPLNCGSCGNVCPDDHPCVDGVCQQCPSGQTKCLDGCFDLQTDPLHCGSCSHACDSDQTCVSGNCQCPGGGVDCSGVCVDIQTDSANCGTCGNACASGETCVGGTCTCGGSVCGASETCCGGTCVDLTSDEANCGACGTACGSGLTCCSGTCVDLQSDENNCGLCGHACS